MEYYSANGRRRSDYRLSWTALLLDQHVQDCDLITRSSLAVAVPC